MRMGIASLCGFRCSYHHITRSTQVDPSVNVRILQAAKIGCIIILFSHWIGAFFYAIARLQDFSSRTWVWDFEKLLPDYRFQESSVSFNYMLCLYKGLNTLSNLAYDVGVPCNLLELVFSFGAMLVQVYISALTLGE